MESFDSVPFFHSAGCHLAFSSWQLPAFGKRRSFSVHSAGCHPAILSFRSDVIRLDEVGLKGAERSPDGTGEAASA